MDKQTIPPLHEYGTLIDILLEKARYQPNQTVYTFLSNGETGAGNLIQLASDRPLSLYTLHPNRKHSSQICLDASRSIANEIIVWVYLKHNHCSVTLDCEFSKQQFRASILRLPQKDQAYGR
jgi:hypothetical protein